MSTSVVLIAAIHPQIFPCVLNIELFRQFMKFARKFIELVLHFVSFVFSALVIKLGHSAWMEVSHVPRVVRASATKIIIYKY